MGIKSKFLNALLIGISAGHFQMACAQDSTFNDLKLLIESGDITIKKGGRVTFSPYAKLVLEDEGLIKMLETEENAKILRNLIKNMGSHLNMLRKCAVVL